MRAFDELMAHARNTRALGEIAGRQSWDQEITMPPGAASQRGEEAAAMEAVLHARQTDPAFGDLLARAEDEADGGYEQANLRVLRHDYDRETRVPADLATAIAKASSLAHLEWVKARQDNDYEGFAPVLAENINLKRQLADAISQGGDRYDALLQGFEPGTTGAEIAAMFDAMRPRLTGLRDRIMGAPEPKGVSGHFDPDAQLDLSRELAIAFGYDLNRGRIDVAAHPASFGSGDDVRITTRTDPGDPFNCIYSTIHEVGHAVYEQAIDPAYNLTPLGSGVSMGVHESQSRICENQLGRSRAYCGWLFDQMTARFGDFGIAGADDFYAAVNKVRSGFIRTEADEVHYNLHVLLRFDLERALIGGDLEVGDLEAAWNDRVLADFGVAVDCPANGVLQDVHWAVGAFGYFPTYSLGNVYAGTLFEALERDVPGYDGALAQGDPGPAVAWLNENVRVYGKLYPPRDVIEQAAGKPPSPDALLTYLEGKFGALYNL